MIDIIYKTVKPSHLRKLPIMQNLKTIFYIIHPFLRETDFQKNATWGLSNFLLLRAGWQEFGASLNGERRE